MFSARLTHAFNAATISPEDQAFLADMGARFPDIPPRFEWAAQYDPPLRGLVVSMRLKTVPRSGWLRIGVPEGEVQTVADHTGSCAFFGLALYDDMPTVSMLTVHDLSETLVTDFTPHDPITKAEKYRLERIGLVFLTAATPGMTDILPRWEAFEAQETLTSHRANDVDKLEMILQAQIYEGRHPHLKEKLQEFWDYVAARLKTPEGHAFFEVLKKNHPNPHPLKLAMSKPYTRPWDKVSSFS